VSNSRLVYSIDGGRVPITDERPRSPRKSGTGIPNDGVVRIFRERGGRGGKIVTVIRGLPGRGLAEVAGNLKRLCGAGGTVKDGIIEIQGDQREKVAQDLREHGYATKLDGG
jgi:translation initiation factor 1